MSLMKSRQQKSASWGKGDWIGATEAAQILGYKSSMPLRDSARRANLIIEFEVYGCQLTVSSVGGQYRFIRSEIQAFIDAKIEAAQATQKKRNRDLRIAA